MRTGNTWALVGIVQNITLHPESVAQVGNRSFGHRDLLGCRLFVGGDCFCDSIGSRLLLGDSVEDWEGSDSLFIWLVLLIDGGLGDIGRGGRVSIGVVVGCGEGGGDFIWGHDQGILVRDSNGNRFLGGTCDLRGVGCLDPPKQETSARNTTSSEGLGEQHDGGMVGLCFCGDGSCSGDVK